MAIQQFALWLEFEYWEDDGSDPENDFFNMMVTLDGGATYALNVWTFKFFEQLRASDDCVRKGYLTAPDLFVERLDRTLMEQVIASLIDTEGLRDEWLVPKDDEDE